MWWHWAFTGRTNRTFDVFGQERLFIPHISNSIGPMPACLASPGGMDLRDGEFRAEGPVDYLAQPARLGTQCAAGRLMARHFATIG